MQVFRTDTAVEPSLAAQVRVKPTGLAAVGSALVDFARRKPVSAAGGAVVLFAILVAILAPVVAPHTQEAVAIAPKFSGPGAAGKLGTEMPTSVKVRAP